MSATGGGRGTRQQRQDWEKLLTEYPFMGSAYQALPEPTWEPTSFHAEPKGVDRAIARFKQKMAGALHLDSEVERLGYTEPELVMLLGGTHVPGHTEGEQLQMEAMIRTADFTALLAKTGELEPSVALTDDLQVMMGPSLGLPSFQFRGDQHARYAGPQVTLGGGERFEALDARLMHKVFDVGTQRIAKIESVPVRAATWAAFVAYQQPYLDGNKRLGRYSMNAVLMSRGFDSITVPAEKKEAYIDEVVGALKTGDLTSHVRFLLAQYDDT